MTEISLLTREDLPEVARIHLLAFPKSALTALGKEAVRRYYLWQIDGPHDCTAHKITISGRTAGYCFGGVFRGALGGFLQANRDYLVRRLMIRPWLVLNPLFRNRLRYGLRVLHNRVAATRSGKTSPSRNKVESYAILAIAVDPTIQGQGLGRALIQAAEEEARRGGFSRMHLTVALNNTVALGFYERLGWRKYPSDSEWKGEMIKDLES